MLCPHCETGIKLDFSGTSNVYPAEHKAKKQWGFDLAHGFCPQCEQLIVLRRYGTYWQHDDEFESSRELFSESEEILYPVVRRSKPVDPEVPERFKNEYVEACAVQEISPKASAALSRRLLQDILHNHFNLKARSLDKEIDLFLELPGVPQALSSQVDAVRNIGNFAAHPLKDSSTGEIIDVEPGEAEWLIGTIEAMFDFVFVQPKRLEELRKRLNVKLAAAGKPPMK
ncbi:DUF4145 domain-containing protein [Nitrospira sp. MA-1]|nr:DUF4145 domain-containing protein [Nitrospira sp. MA-1]